MGELAVWDGRAVRIVEICAPDRIQVEALGTVGASWVGVDDLEPFVANISKRTIRCASDADPEKENLAVAWTDALKRLSMATGSDAKKAEIAREFGVSLRTVDRRYARFRADPTPEGQIDAQRGPPIGSRRLSPLVEKIIDEAYEAVYLQRESPRVSDFCEAIDAACRKEHLPSPTRRAVQLRIASKDPMYALVRRKGNELAEALQKPSVAGLNVSRPLEVVQIDHAIVDVIVVSEDTRQEIGRPWITLAIDVFSRVIVGWYLSLDVPNQTSVGMCIEHACFPKREFLQSLGLEFDYPVYGKPEQFHWDNAWSFQAKGISIQCERRGIATIVRPVKKPHWGAYIERYIGTLMGKVHLLRGTTFSNTVQRKGYDSQGRAEMTMSELKKWLAIEIAQRYFNAKHRGLDDQRPASVWTSFFRDAEGRVKLPAIMGDRRDFLLGFLPFKYRVVSREGIALFKLFFWDPALTPLINKPEKFRVHYRQDDLSRIWLYHDGDYSEIPLLDRSIPPFSYRELKQARKEKRTELPPEREHHQNEVANAVMAKRALEDEAACTSRAARRNRASRPDAQPPSQPKVNYSKPAARLDPSLVLVK
ncbi:Mu transposase C-terminal domain-containing protein [Lysobacter auxotrophicus]|uniref:DDE-type integrase/transposase/recombinase n=1 Tax=Lysobacter auxotrophicus TaxID=2992573 RepID=A0ABM8DDF4_9GAMM|nr:Mu transposase C-terminal domain-containing protein [Lysobacter auxotrophicus]BDU16627.1 DDE-type integrase/transposase/recombinase [Lysobacter auxotrophicus]